MESKVFCCYEFGEFRLDARRRSLLKNGEKTPLPARNFDLLLYMVENGGRILEHDELLDQVWAGTFVEQATLKKGISALRQILGEKPENEFIKTIPRRGYSFVSPVRVVEKETEIVHVSETESKIIFRESPNETARINDKAIEIPAAGEKSLPADEPKKLNLNRVAILCIAGIAAIALAIFGLPYFSKNVEPQFSVENVRINRITNTGKVTDTVISPDGSYLLYPAADKDGVSLWLRQMSANSTNRLTLPVKGGFWGFAFAPDNSYIYYIFNNHDEPQKSGLYKLPLIGGEPRRIMENVSSIAVSPDGKTIALVRINEKTNIFTTNPDGEDEKIISVLPAEVKLWGISWTPDGESLLCTFRKTVENKTLFFVSEISPETGKEIFILPPQDKFIFGAVWLPDKSAILLTMREPNADIRQIWQYFPASEEWRRVTNDNNSYKFINLTRDGKTIVSNQESRLAAIWISDNLPLDKRNTEKKSLLNNADNFRQITDGVNNFDRLSWLADRSLIYSTTDDSKEMVFTVNADGKNPQQITDGNDGIWISPSATGNGQSIGFLSSRTGARQVWRIDEDGKNLTQITRTNSPVSAGRILRDNSTVIFTMQQAKGVFLFRQSADEQSAVQLTDSSTGLFAVSADEKMLAVETLDENTRKYRVELRRLPDGQLIKLFDFLPKRQLSFTPDGKNLAYDALHNGLNQIMIQPVDGGEPFALTDFRSDNIFSFDWSPDGKHLAIIRGNQLNDAVLIKSNSR